MAVPLWICQRGTAEISEFKRKHRPVTLMYMITDLKCDSNCRCYQRHQTGEDKSITVDLFAYVHYGHFFFFLVWSYSYDQAVRTVSWFEDWYKTWKCHQCHCRAGPITFCHCYYLTFKEELNRPVLTFRWLLYQYAINPHTCGARAPLQAPPTFSLER